MLIHKKHRDIDINENSNMSCLMDWMMVVAHVGFV